MSIRMLLCLIATSLGTISLDAFAAQMYLDWGYNRNFWDPSDIHVRQPALGNNFVVHKVAAEDYAQWDEGLMMLDKPITTPQYHLRTGMIFGNNFGVELSIDHTKFSSIIGQNARVSGMIQGQEIDETKVLDKDFFRYNLHNGANHIMVSLMKGISIDSSKMIHPTLWFKGGGGIMLPHSDNTILGQNNKVGSKNIENAVGLETGWWQVNGWTVGCEISFRLGITNDIFLEISDKEAYAKLENVPVYQGRASQSLWMNAVLFSLGYNFSTEADASKN